MKTQAFSTKSGRSIYTLTLLLPPLLAAVAAGEDWPHWRGPDHDSKSPEPLASRNGKITLPDPAWKHNVGEGCGTVVVGGDSVYTTGWSKGQETAWCLSARDGSVKWSKSSSSPRYGRHAVGDKGSYSGPTATPTLDTDSGLTEPIKLSGHIPAGG